MEQLPDYITKCDVPGSQGNTTDITITVRIVV